MVLLYNIIAYACETRRSRTKMEFARREAALLGNFLLRYRVAHLSSYSGDMEDIYCPLWKQSGLFCPMETYFDALFLLMSYISEHKSAKVPLFRRHWSFTLHKNWKRSVLNLLQNHCSVSIQVPKCPHAGKNSVHDYDFHLWQWWNRNSAAHRNMLVCWNTIFPSTKDISYLYMCTVKETYVILSRDFMTLQR